MRPLLPIGLARRHQGRPVVRWVSALQHALKDGIGVAFAAGGAQGGFIIHPGENNDPGFRVEPKKQPESSTHFARRQWRNAVPSGLPCRYASRCGSLGTTSKMNGDSAANSLTMALDAKPRGSCRCARSAAACSFWSCSIVVPSITDGVHLRGFGRGWMGWEAGGIGVAGGESGYAALTRPTVWLLALPLWPAR
jgi:hypothetical protein